jgi:HAD superfamily hydrolase (TIGR01458 family)
VSGVVLDMEGVLHVDWRALPGAGDAVARLRAAGVDPAILTNTTGRTRAGIAEKLAELGIPFPAERIVTAAWATAYHVRSAHPGARVYLLGEQGAAAEFGGVSLVDSPEEADVIVVAGPDAALAYPLLNRVFRVLVDGRQLVAMQHNRWWPTVDGPAMDAGGIVAALEYSSGVTATVVGKPSEEIYRAALEVVGAEPADAVMVGDDLPSDLEPAARLGMRTCLVHTGKGAGFADAAGPGTEQAADLRAFVDRLLA